MKQVEAKSGFDHGGMRRRGDRFQVSDKHAEQLEAAGLVRVLDDGPTPAHPSTAAGEKSSASRAAPASPKKTAKPSGRGAKKAQTEE